MYETRQHHEITKSINYVPIPAMHAVASRCPPPLGNKEKSSGLARSLPTPASPHKTLASGAVIQDPIHPRNSIRLWFKGTKKPATVPGQAFVVVVVAAAGHATSQPARQESPHPNCTTSRDRTEVRPQIPPSNKRARQETHLPPPSMCLKSHPQREKSLVNRA